MNTEPEEEKTVNSSAIVQWRALLHHDVSLLPNPGTRQKALLIQAHALHLSQGIDADDLSDLPELADGPLAFAVES